MSKIACVFPGQGSQSVGMGLDLFDKSEIARSVFTDIDSFAGRSLSKLCFTGPESELKKTINTQPTILAMSLAAWKCYEHLQGPKPAFVAGHSLGEFTALVAASVLSVEAAVHLVDKRSRLMEECPSGAMSAVIGVAPDILETICRDTTTEFSSTNSGSVVIVANFNTREQLVISGSPEAVEKAGVKAKASGGKVIPLPVGGAFHSPLMSTAAQEFNQEIGKYSFSDALIPVVQNYDAQSATISGDIKEKLSKQMPNSVHWCETIEYMLSNGVDTFIEIGPGKALAGMIKKIDQSRSAKIFNINDYETLQATIQTLKETVPAN